MKRRARLTTRARAFAPEHRIGCGIRTIEDLRDRCRIDDITRCWHWAGGCDGNGRPSLWLPALGKRVTLGVAICVLLNDVPPKKGVVWHCTCATPNCAFPGHRKAGTRSSQMLAAKLIRTQDTRSRIARTKRATSKLSEDDVAEIRDSDETLVAVAARFGTSVSHASKIRRGEQRGPLGASVFNVAHFMEAA